MAGTGTRRRYSSLRRNIPTDVGRTRATALNQSANQSGVQEAGNFLQEGAGR